MTARQSRSFDAAFQNVFGEPPGVLYGFYTAELTRDAMKTDQPRVEGAEWQDLKWRTESWDVSVDGAMLATVIRSRTKPSRLVLSPPTPPSRKRRKRKSMSDASIACSRRIPGCSSGPYASAAAKAGARTGASRLEVDGRFGSSALPAICCSSPTRQTIAETSIAIFFDGRLQYRGWSA